jgi:hydrogenase maturation protease
VPRPLVIGVGALHAGDDEAGRLVARKLLETQCDCDVTETHGLAADLVNLMEGRKQVVIVDACRSKESPGTVLKVNANSGDLPAALNASSSHGMGVGEGIRLAQALNVLPDSCEIWLISGSDFRLGQCPGPPVQLAISKCVADLKSMF